MSGRGTSVSGSTLRSTLCYSKLIFIADNFTFRDGDLALMLRMFFAALRLYGFLLAIAFLLY